MDLLVYLFAYLFYQSVQKKQEAQLSQRDCALLRVIKHFSEGHTRSLELTPLSRACVSPCQYSIETMSVSRTVSEIQRYISRKSRFFNTPLQSTPPLRGPRRNIAITFGISKTGIVWLLGGVKSLMICRTVSTEYRRATDRQTDGQTDILRQHSRAMHSIAR